MSLTEPDESDSHLEMTKQMSLAELGPASQSQSITSQVDIACRSRHVTTYTMASTKHGDSSSSGANDNAAKEAPSQQESAGASSKNFQNTVQIEALQNLCVPNITNPWKDAATQFAGQGKIDAADHIMKMKKKTKLRRPVTFNCQRGKKQLKLQRRTNLNFIMGHHL